MKSQGQDTIFITVPYGVSARNILRSDALKILRSRSRVVILCPLYRDPGFIEEFSSENILLRDLPHRLPFAFRALRRFLDVAEGYYFTKKSGITTLNILRESLRHDAVGLFYQRTLIGALLGRQFVLNYLRSIQIKLVKNDYYDRLFDEFKPAMVFLTHVMALEEFPAAFYGRARGVPVLAMLHSWDVINTKTGIRGAVSMSSGRLPPLHFDKVLVWNEIQKKELMDYWNYRDKDIEMVGVPQFDIYIQLPPAPREKFLKLLGGDPRKKTIAYLAGNPNMLPRQMEIVDMLVQWLKENKYSQPSQLLIRLHPGLDTNYLLSLRGQQDILLDEPSIAFSANRFSKGWRAGREDEVRLAGVLSSSDVVLNVLSTSSLDAAAFDRPVISVAFDGYTNMPYYRSIVRYYDWTHYQTLMKTGGLRIARRPEDLLQEINRYLNNPAMDHAGRAEIVRSHCYRLDGKAGERIGNFLAAQLDFVHPKNSPKHYRSLSAVSGDDQRSAAPVLPQ
ncbi:MAG: hypothetical protein HY547_07070 [Elusimicrobia bacterium]|nr:hypothetical protein [Elusimicrobiota bacterium]